MIVWLWVTHTSCGHSNRKEWNAAFAPSIHPAWLKLTSGQKRGRRKEKEEEEEEQQEQEEEDDPEKRQKASALKAQVMGPGEGATFNPRMQPACHSQKDAYLVL